MLLLLFCLDTGPARKNPSGNPSVYMCVRVCVPHIYICVCVCICAYVFVCEHVCQCKSVCLFQMALTLTPVQHMRREREHAPSDRVECVFVPMTDRFCVCERESERGTE